jgi:SAM-dependent methyltransferase
MSRLFPNFSQRLLDPEVMDDPQARVEDVAAALSDLRRINRYLRVTSALTRHLFPMIRQLGNRSVSILDVGTGAADIPQAIVTWGRRQGVAIRIVAVDVSHIVLKVAQANIRGGHGEPPLQPLPNDSREISLVRADALDLPFGRSAFDFAVATEFLHHLEADEIADFLRRLHEITRVAFIINDLHRHPVAYYGFTALSRLFFRSRFVRHDGPVSILRGFTDQDFREIKSATGLNSLTLHFHFPYRVVIVGKK